MVLSFSVLIYYGTEIYKQAPPIPDKVVTASGTVLFTGQDIKDGQNVWQSVGGQEIGTIWGHGAYQAPDWSADWLHKEAVFMLDGYAMQNDSTSFGNLDTQKQAALKIKLQDDIRANRYDVTTKTLLVSESRALAIASNSVFYTGLFMNDPSATKLREAYSLPINSVKDPERMRKLNAFFFWTPWACVNNRPNSDITSYNFV